MCCKSGIYVRWIAAGVPMSLLVTWYMFCVKQHSWPGRLTCNLANLVFGIAVKLLAYLAVPSRVYDMLLLW